MPWSHHQCKSHCRRWHWADHCTPAIVQYCWWELPIHPQTSAEGKYRPTKATVSTASQGFIKYHSKICKGVIMWGLLEWHLPWFCFWGCSHICTHQNKCACGSWGHPSQGWDWRQGGGPEVRHERCVCPGSSHLRTQWSGARTETFRWQLVQAAPERRGWCNKCGAWFSSAGWALGPASCISQRHTCRPLPALSTLPLQRQVSDQRYR